MAIQFLIDLLTGNLVLVEVPGGVVTPPVFSYLLQEDGFSLLQEDGSKIVLE